MKLIFATNNQNKVDEIQSAIGNQIEVISLNEAGIDIDIPEPHETLEENASEKSRTIFSITGINCFSEDTWHFSPQVHHLTRQPPARYLH